MNILAIPKKECMWELKMIGLVGNLRKREDFKSDDPASRIRSWRISLMLTFHPDYSTGTRKS